MAAGDPCRAPSPRLQRVSRLAGGETELRTIPRAGRHAPEHLDPAAFANPTDIKGVEVDRCVYDNMIDRAVVDPLPPVGCSASRETRSADVKFVHFTVCQKPWSCNPNRDPNDENKICMGFHQKWFELRREFEASRGMPTVEKACFKGYHPMDFTGIVR